MDNLVWIIYLIDLISKPRVVMEMLLLTVFIAGVMVYLYVSVNDDEYSVKLKQVPYRLMMVIPLVYMVMQMFIPSEDAAYKMLAAYGVTEVAKNENVQGMMGDGLAILQLTLKKHRVELEGKTND